MNIIKDDLNSEKISITMPSNILAQIDAQVGGGFVDREEFIRSAVRNYLTELRDMNNAQASNMG